MDANIKNKIIIILLLIFLIGGGLGYKYFINNIILKENNKTILIFPGILQKIYINDENFNCIQILEGSKNIKQKLVIYKDIKELFVYFNNEKYIITCKNLKIIYENNKLSLDGFNIPLNRSGVILKNGKTEFTFNGIDFEGETPLSIKISI